LEVQANNYNIFLAIAQKMIITKKIFDDWQLIKEISLIHRAKITETNKHILAKGFIGWALQNANANRITALIQLVFI
jgi:hypothetical protein